MLNHRENVVLNNQTCILDVLDLNFNKAPLGTLWVIHTEDSGSRVVKGIIHRFTKQLLPIIDPDQLYVNIPDLDTLVALYNEEFPKPEVWYKRLYKKFLALVTKHKHDYEYGD